MATRTQMQRYHWVQNNGKGFIQLPGLNHAAAFHFFGTRLLAGDEITDLELGSAESSLRTRQVHGDRICQVKISPSAKDYDLRGVVKISPNAQSYQGHDSRADLLGGVPLGGGNANHGAPMTGAVETGSGPGQQGPGPWFSKEIGEGDGLTTDCPGVLINVSTADCVPVLLLDPVRKAVSAVHAGWRGTVLNISAKAVESMRFYYGTDPANLRVGIGPAIGPCCYEVGNDVWEQVEREYFYGGEVLLREKNGKAMLDLVHLNRLQLIEAGVSPDRLFFSGLCTSCFPSLFYSFRRDQKRVGNMTSGIMLNALP